MNNIVLSRSIRNLGTSPIILPLLYPALRTFRAASLNSAIQHGIRRSKGVGFRGKERSRSQDAGQSYRGREGPSRRSAESSRGSASRSQMRIVGSDDKPSSFSLGNRNPPYKTQDPVSSFRMKPFGKEGKLVVGGLRRNERDRQSLGRSTSRPPRDSDQFSLLRRDTKDYKRETPQQGSRSHGRPSNRKETYPSLSIRKTAYGSPSRASYSEEMSPSNDKSTWQYGSQERRSKSDANGPSSRFGFTNNQRDVDLPSQSPRIDARIPVSIPYTTPASDFLYGTSVVEAALSSSRVPRRKHYKLYIYNGENREGSSVERDASLERLAKKNGVDVVRVSSDWLRIMDKMSGGRPHNGYILEASPLPRKPITSLGEFTITDGQSGFKVSLDHQSREEAAVNGTDDFINYSSNVPGRKPLVLLLDSIIDPGNLGGIIRTASFLGVTAIAVSTRNSASFTSVVLKASAGASENVTLFSVNKPAGFLVDSKAAGWKIFAAVAPSSRKDPDIPETMTTDQLEDPLSEDPCILMLGGEGEGLRWNLRSKADVDLSIRGSGQSHNVDSLNVSVAAGILCSSFLRRSNAEMNSRSMKEAKVEGNVEPTGNMF